MSKKIVHETQAVLTKNRFIDYISYLLTGLFILAGIIVSLNRYWQFEVFYYDFGIFDTAIWNVSRFNPPTIDHLVVGGKWIFADHFNPSIFLLSPLYWFTSQSEILLIAQALLVGLTGIIIYITGKTVLNNAFLSFSVLVSYFLFIGIQNAVITDFHEVTVSVFTLSLIFLAVVKRYVFLYFSALLITLGFKESIFLIGVGIGIAIFFIEPRWRKIALATIVLSFIWGILSIKVVIPYFSEGLYQYSSELPLSPIHLIEAFFNNSVKVNTLFYSFLSFGFLPFFAFRFLPLIFLDFMMRFVPMAPTRWDLGLHYSAQLSEILSVAAIYALKYIFSWDKISRISNVFVILFILNAFILYRFVLHGPFALSYNPAFYKHTKDFLFLDELVMKVPKEGTVMTQNNLGPRFSHQGVLMLRYKYDNFAPKYIVIDNRSGQNPNNFFPSEDIKIILEKIESDSKYAVLYRTKDQYIFKKK